MIVAQVPVLIVGAGAGGLTTSAVLARHGVSSLLVDKRREVFVGVPGEQRPRGGGTRVQFGRWIEEQARQARLQRGQCQGARQFRRDLLPFGKLARI